MISNKKELICYKKMEIDSNNKLTFFLEKHSTKEGTWGKLSLQEGAIDFVFLNGKGEELSRTRINEENPELLVPPGSWHKIITVSDYFKSSLDFYCMPHRYYKKKYGLGSVHSDVLYLYHTYLSGLDNLSVLDVGCGSGRNLAYLNKMGHRVMGVDCNQSSLDSIQDIVKKEGLLEADTLLHDLNDPLDMNAEQYDLVLSTVSLQFLNPTRIPKLLVELQEATQTKGYHYLVFPIQSETYSLPESFTYLPQEEELYRFYQDSGWSILEYKESIGNLHKKDEKGKLISGLFGCLLAQKPL